ncbi:hypothetical protein PRIPAC_95517 [Pristionchus pacificus]|uniref:G protein-coupled receptor n=1 Tax=Pristionchus pacificus TaxID=54126 RepID=A0A2A6CGS6_PRIPA|nr:hypothetical protein PRIPAC_95517 [Pristionchus pacificus]|eukprot:PDM77424.1 G protein-coupled receptor [Pristionchus pacificus]
MTLVSPLSPRDSSIIRHTKIILTIMSFLAALITIAVIVSCKDRPSTKYSRLILSIVYISIISDLYLQLLYDPVFFLPIPCFARENPLLLRVSGTSAIHHCIWSALATLNAPFFLACFIHRHQVVISPSSRWSFSSRVQNVPPLAFLALVFVFPILLHMLSTDWPSTLLARTDCFFPDRILIFCIVATVGLVTGSVSVFLIVLHTFAILRDQPAISARMKKYHRTMTRVLIVQSGFPAVFALFPLAVCFVVYFLDLNGIRILPACFICFSAYSLLHSISVLATTPIYRKKLCMMVRMKKIATNHANKEGSSITPRINTLTRFAH